MATKMTGVIQHLCRLALRDGAEMTDGQLLNAFVRQQDDTALAALVDRHGPMVWGVCRRLLRSHQDAEDAFQATFLVLVHKAAAVRDKETVANWLYGVAHQTAVRVRATVAKRQGREQPMKDVAEPAAKEADLLLLLDEELNRLPDKYRVLIVLCDLEGKTRKEVARQLGCPEGTVAGRLARARTMLANRLRKHGLAVTGATLAATLSQKVASACVPASLVTSTTKAVTLTAAGQAMAGVISSKVAALTQGVLKTMLLTKLKAASAAALLVFGLVGLGAGLLTQDTASARQRGDGVTKAADGAKVSAAEGKGKKVGEAKKAAPKAEADAVPLAKAVVPAAPPEDADSWSKPTRGLQARITFVERPKFNGTRSIVPYLELQNVSGNAYPLKVRCDTGHVKFELVDAGGKVVPGYLLPRGGPHPDPGTIVLPLDSEMRIGMHCTNWGVPKDAAAMISTDSGAWVLQTKEKGKVFLRATIKGAKVDSDPDRMWYGAIVTPPVKVDWSE